MTKEEIIDILYTAYSDKKGYDYVSSLVDNCSEYESTIRKYLIDGTGLEKLVNSLFHSQYPREVETSSKLLTTCNHLTV
jgi:hypothetical protein